MSLLLCPYSALTSMLASGLALLGLSAGMLGGWLAGCVYVAVCMWLCDGATSYSVLVLASTLPNAKRLGSKRSLSQQERGRWLAGPSLLAGGCVQSAPTSDQASRPHLSDAADRGAI